MAEKSEKLMKFNRWMTILPLIIGIAIVPLVVQARNVYTNAMDYVTWRNIDSYVDFFGRGKLEVLMVAGFIAIIMVLINLRQKTNPYLYKYYMLIGGFGILIIISTYSQRYINYIETNFSFLTYNLSILTEEFNTNVSLWGFPERFEGLVAWMCYFALFMLGMKHLSKERDYGLLFTSLVVSAGIIGLVGITQLLGHDLFHTSFGQWLMNLTALDKMDLSAMTFAFQNREIYSTLFNPNYVGSYIALVLPIIVAMTISIDQLKVRIILLVVDILLLINLLGSGSLTGMIGITISAFVVAIFNRKLLMKYIKIWGPIVLVLIIVATLFIAKSDGRFARKIRRNIDGIVTDLSGGNMLDEGGYEQILGLSGSEQVIYIETNERSLYIQQQGIGVFSFYDEMGEPLEFVYNDSGQYYYFTDADFQNIQFQFEYDAYQQVIIAAKISGGTLYFQFLENMPYTIGHNGNIYPINYVVPSIGFENNQTFATNRGYIWSKTLPIIKDTWLIGTGPDTFEIVFPQYDVIGKRNMYGMANFIVDKPHNMYLQIAVQTGLLSLLVFIALMVVYFARFLKSFRNLQSKSSKLYYMNIGITVGMLGFLVAGVGNDSTLASGALFWTLLGVGISLQVIANHEDPIEITDEIERELVAY